MVRQAAAGSRGATPSIPSQSRRRSTPRRLRGGSDPRGFWSHSWRRELEAFVDIASSTAHRRDRGYCRNQIGRLQAPHRLQFGGAPPGGVAHRAARGECMHCSAQHAAARCHCRHRDFERSSTLSSSHDLHTSRCPCLFRLRSMRLTLLAICPTGHLVPFRLLKASNGDRTPLYARPFKCPTCGSRDVASPARCPLSASG